MLYYDTQLLEKNNRGGTYILKNNISNDSCKPVFVANLKCDLNCTQYVDVENYF